ncbi:hypothetical protein [Streptomyces longisporus]
MAAHELATSAQWAASLFTGSVLIVALVLTGGRITHHRQGDGE